MSQPISTVIRPRTQAWRFYVSSLIIEIDTITFSNYSSSVTPVLESLACCFVSPTIPTPKATSRQSVLISYVLESAGHLTKEQGRADV